MKFFAYVPTPSGQEPMGTQDKMLFELKTIEGAIRRVNRYARYSDRCVLFTYTNFYREETFKKVYENGKRLRP